MFVYLTIHLGMCVYMYECMYEYYTQVEQSIRLSFQLPNHAFTC